ncbi:hypothetical protein ACFXAS_30165 [Streptomyces sp. NPDC059459]|uniref:hypothetical protein n=1 Tax=Streptomyces sp. NPDC059459 TaxID=3346839 RepID=UPI003680D922
MVSSAGADVVEALASAARERLRTGAAPAVVCGELAGQTRWWWDAALAVGQARGIPKPELLRRVRSDPERVQHELGPGQEDLYGELLERSGVFDVAKQLDERELVIAKHLRSAIGAIGGVASGRALGLSRRLVLGELADVFRSLARSGPRADRGRPREFWEALVSAGELLDPADGDDQGTVAQALDSCRAHMADPAR